MRSPYIVATLAVLLLAAPVLAQPGGGGPGGATPVPGKMSLNTNAAEPGEYTLDETHQSLILRVRHLDTGYTTMRFDTVKGTLNWDPVDVTKSKVTMYINVGSLSSPVQTSMVRGLTFAQLISGPMWLDAPQFPVATFTSTKITKKDATHGTIEGTLTLRGITKTVKVDAQLLAAGIGGTFGVPTVAFTGIAKIKRTDYGVTAMPDPIVGDEVELVIDVEFNRIQ